MVRSLVSAGGGSSGSSGTSTPERDDDDTRAASDVANDIRAQQSGSDQNIEVDTSGSTDLEVTDHDGGANNGGVTVVNPEPDQTDDRVAVTNEQNDQGETTGVSVTQEDTRTTTTAPTPNADPSGSSSSTPNNRPTNAGEPVDVESRYGGIALLIALALAAVAALVGGD